MQLNSRMFPTVYESLGVTISDLGCIMLDVVPFDVTRHVEHGKDDLYFGTHPALKYAQGAVAEKSAHITLLFGLMESGPKWRKEVDEVLEGWVPPAIHIKDVSFFPSNIQGEDYSCIVGKIEVTPELLEANQRLQLLPHINTFPEYTPHVTLAYIKNGPSGVQWAESTLDKWLISLSPLEGAALPVRGLNYGGNE